MIFLFELISNLELRFLQGHIHQALYCLDTLFITFHCQRIGLFTMGAYILRKYRDGYFWNLLKAQFIHSICDLSLRSWLRQNLSHWCIWGWMWAHLVDIRDKKIVIFVPLRFINFTDNLFFVSYFIFLSFCFKVYFVKDSCFYHFCTIL